MEISPSGLISTLWGPIMLQRIDTGLWNVLLTEARILSSPSRGMLIQARIFSP